MDEEVKKPRKPRSGSTFLLLGVLPRESPDEPQRCEILQQCRSVKACREAAIGDDVTPGDFIVACVRDKFGVKEKQLKLIERTK